MCKVDIREIIFNVSRCLESEVLFTECRVNETTVPDFMYCYRLQYNKSSLLPFTLMLDAADSCFGTIFSMEPLLSVGEEMRAIPAGDFCHTDGRMTVSYYFNRYAGRFEGLDNLNKESWVALQLGLCPAARREVLEFIADVIFVNGRFSKDILDKFKKEFCYYFAVMLQDAFKSQGQLYFDIGSNSVVWGKGDLGICYSAAGVLMCDVSVLKTIDQLGPYMDFFSQRGFDKKIKEDIASFAKKRGLTINGLMRRVYESIPVSQRFYKHFNFIDVYKGWHDYIDFLCDL